MVSGALLCQWTFFAFYVFLLARVEMLTAFHVGLFVYSLGQQFATIEAITIMSMLMQKFEFELVEPNKEPAYHPSLTLPMAHGLPVRIKHRVNA